MVPLKRMVEKGIEGEALSPMDPPGAYAPPTVEIIPLEHLAAPLQQLILDHQEFLKVLNAFDNALVELKKREWRFNPEISAAMKNFFQFMDREIPLHTKKEEKGLFPILHEKILASGEHSPGVNPKTPVDVMESDHEHVHTMASLVFNLMGLAPRLRDAESRSLVFEHAFEQGQDIVETMKLHIYKEDATLFQLAQKLLSDEEMEKVAETFQMLD